MESIGASGRVMGYLDRPPAPQLSGGRVLPYFTGRVRTICPCSSRAAWGTATLGAQAERFTAALGCSPIVGLFNRHASQSEGWDGRCTHGNAAAGPARFLHVT